MSFEHCNDLHDTSLNAVRSFNQIHKARIGCRFTVIRSIRKGRIDQDIGRHKCFDKITGLMLKRNKLDLFSQAVVFVSGRIASEIMTKIIRMGVGVPVSKSTPTTAEVKLA